MTDIDCCEECNYWEERADINTEHEIKMKIKSEETTILAIPKLNKQEPINNEQTEVEVNVNINNLEKSDDSVVGTKSPQ
tara:strand:- start:13381 stop:13617 length:237 start_codon:yes stop_codon:yes gene_type:complete